jgi:hypothetical protein
MSLLTVKHSARRLLILDRSSEKGMLAVLALVIPVFIAPAARAGTVTNDGSFTSEPAANEVLLSLHWNMGPLLASHCWERRCVWRG